MTRLRLRLILVAARLAGLALRRRASPERRARAEHGRDEIRPNGQSLVEFALILPVLLLLIVGVFDLARIVFDSTTLSSAVREGTRYAIVHGASSSSPTGPGAASYTAPGTDTTITTIVTRAAIGVNTPTVTAVWSSGDAYRGSPVTVAATFPFTPTLSSAFLGGALQVTLSASSTLDIQR